MWQPKSILSRGLCVFIMVAFFGCVPASSIDTDKARTTPWPGDVYYPKLPAGIGTLDDAKKDLAALVKNERPGIKYYGQQDINHLDGKESLKALLKGKKGSAAFWYDSREELMVMSFENIAVLDDRIEASPRIAFFYTDLIDNHIVVRKKTAEEKQPAECHPIDREGGIGWVGNYIIFFPDLISFHFIDSTLAQRFADDLLWIQQGLQKNQAEQLALFEAKAAEYRALKVKPPVPEEQRRLIVQANAMNQQKEYGGAIGLYRKAIELDPVSYPSAYFNMALLYAQERRFKLAISCMKQYLVLEPEAKDARSAQDKIYEWEIMTKK